MKILQMGSVESNFADIIWSNEPITSSELAKISEQRLKWKKTTSFTVLKRLCNKGIFKNEKGIVTSLISRSDFYSMQSNNYVEENFNGSLPAFLAAFTARKTLSKKEIDEIRAMIDSFKED